MISVKWWTRRRKMRVTPELAEARQAREAAEALLRESRHTVIVPLREMRQQNHIGEMIDHVIRTSAKAAREAR